MASSVVVKRLQQLYQKYFGTRIIAVNRKEFYGIKAIGSDSTLAINEIGTQS